MINVLQINLLRKLIPANQLIVSPSKPRNSHLIDTCNKNPTYGSYHGQLKFVWLLYLWLSSSALTWSHLLAFTQVPLRPFLLHALKRPGYGDISAQARKQALHVTSNTYLYIKLRLKNVQYVVDTYCTCIYWDFGRCTARVLFKIHQGGYHQINWVRTVAVVQYLELHVWMKHVPHVESTPTVCRKLVEDFGLTDNSENRAKIVNSTLMIICMDMTLVVQVAKFKFRSSSDTRGKVYSLSCSSVVWW